MAVAATTTWGGADYADILTRIMNADLAAIPDSYDEACHLELPGGSHGAWT